jgi:hypothetical protein
MNLDILANVLDINVMELVYRIKTIENLMYNFYEDTECEYPLTDTMLKPRDINIIIKIVENVKGEFNRLAEHDSLLEIVILYLFIMEISHEEHNTSTIGNYFGIINFTSILLNNCTSFSKPYLRFLYNGQ